MSQPDSESSRTVVLAGGRIVDPKNGIDQVGDVTVVDGKIAAVGERPADAASEGGAALAHQVIDVTGKLVIPGLIDFHCHIYHGVGAYGLHPDRPGWRSGVTRVNDIGSTGWMTLEGFRYHIARPATSRVSCFPNIVGLGIPENWAGVLTLGPGEATRSDLLVAVARQWPELVRGVKVHMEAGMMAMQGNDGWAGFEASRRVTNELGLNLYVHLGGLVPNDAGFHFDPALVPLNLVERMHPREVLGHCFTPHPGGLVDERGEVHPAAFAATEKGLFHEVGHGINMSFERARHFLAAGLRPDIISSDAHGYAHCGVIKNGILWCDIDGTKLNWTMVGTMSKVWGLGVELAHVIEASTWKPAQAIRVDEEEGHLTVGSVADITVLDMESGEFTFTDSTGGKLVTDRALRPHMTVLGGRAMELDLSQLPEFERERDPALAGMRPVVDR